MTASYHMSPDAFRRHGHALVDWIADYMERVEGLPVQPDVEPGAIRALLPEHLRRRRRSRSSGSCGTWTR